MFGLISRGLKQGAALPQEDMRYAYVKYGDVVKELREIGPAPISIPAGGPMTYAANFLQMAGSDPVLLISWDSGGAAKAQLRVGTVEAYKRRRPKGLTKLVATGEVLFRLIAFRPDVVLCVHEGPGLWAAFLACKLLRVPLLHSRQRAVRLEDDSRTKRISSIVDSFVIRRAARVICHGPFARNQLLEIGVSEARIVGFSARFDDLMLEPQQAAAVPDNQRDWSQHRILYVGRVEESKGVYDLLEASLPILNSRDNVNLTYVGDGGALAELQARVEKERFTSRVTFTGEIAHDDLAVHYKSATVLVAPTRRGLEGWPKVAREALVMGVPVIAPSAGPFPFIIENGVNGLLYDADSISDLRVKIERVLDNMDLRQALSDGATISSRREAASAVSFGEALRTAYTGLK